MTKIVYIAHPISNDVERNLARIESIVGLLMTRDSPWGGRVQPIAPYLSLFGCLNNSDPKHYALGLESNRVYFERKFVDELWVCADPMKSKGVQTEIAWAQKYNIPVFFRDFDGYDHLLKSRVENVESRSEC